MDLAFSSLKGLKLWFWFKKSDGFFKKPQKNQWKPRPNVGSHKFTGHEHSFFQETPFPRMDLESNPFPWNGLGQILGCGFASQQGRVERQLQVTHRNLGFGYPGAYDA